MQPIHSSRTVNTPPSSKPSDAQLHTGQLEDYELLLSTLRETPTNFVFPDVPIKPYSPLTQMSEDGLKALWQLLRDRDYIDLCTRRQLKQGDMGVKFEDGKFVYNTWSNTGHRVTLELTEHVHWGPLKRRIEQTAAQLGGELNSNRRISFDGMCGFYGIESSPWSVQQQQAMATVLQERLASCRLRLEEDFETLDLARSPNEADRTRFRVLQEAFPGTPIDTQMLHTHQVRAELIEAVNQFLPEAGLSPLTYLAKAILAKATTEHVRATPTVYLENILQGTEAGRLGDVLLKTMEWYGGNAGEETSPHIRIRLIANALQHWLTSQAFDNPDMIAGFDWQSRTHWGKSYQAILAEFEAFLLTSKRAATEKEAIVIARLFLPRCPIEFRVRNIPQALPYRGSVVWVNFLNGVNIVKAIAPEQLDRLTFHQLVNLPIQFAMGATPQELDVIALARSLPALDWAVSLGIIQQKHRENYTQDDIDQALSGLDKHTDQINEAIIRISEAPPKRLSMAATETEKLFGAGAFTEDGRKLARRDQAGPTSFRDPPPLKGKEFNYYSFVDVLASGKFDDQQQWRVTQSDGATLSPQWIRIKEHRRIQTEAPWRKTGDAWVMSPFTQMPDLEALFDTAFKQHLKTITAAYETLIRSQLASLPFADRQALEFGEVRIYSLRKKALYTLAEEETPESILALRARNGLILQTTHDNKTIFHELLPKAGVIRRLDHFDPELIGGRLVPQGLHLDGRRMYSWADKILPFDWDAHSDGGQPGDNARCQAIVEQLGPAISAAHTEANTARHIPSTLSSSRTMEISHHIASELLFVDPVALRSFAYGQTRFDREQARGESALRIAKMFVPFWNSIEDVQSGDRSRIRMGVIGLFFDVLSFGLPIGKFATGSIRVLSSVTGQLRLRAALPSFASLTKHLVISLASALNPLDIIPALLRGSGRILKGIWNASAIHATKQLRHGRYFEYVRSLPQLGDTGHWKPTAAGDQLALVKGVDDVPVRNVATSGNPDYRVIDPLSSKPYGPALSSRLNELSPGRSHYPFVESTHTHVTVKLAQNTRVSEVLEFDGTRTFFLNDVPYRLHDGSLRRVSSLDASEKLRPVACRIPRAPGGVCKTRYVLAQEPAPRPQAGTFTQEKSWATWFGDGSFYPSTPKSANERSLLAFEGKIYELKDGKLNTYKGKPEWIGLEGKTPIPKATVSATVEFQTGIYAGIKITGTAEKIDDGHHVGSIILSSVDGQFQYVFSKINIDDYYMARLSSADSLLAPLTMKKLTTSELLPGTPGEELRRVYAGSLNANNTARLYGINEVERALDRMDEMATSIGAPVNPPADMKFVKVDTHSAEAVMFDYRTRTIVAELPEGAALWKPSSLASAQMQSSATEVFDALFKRGGSAATKSPSVTIDQAMVELQKLLPSHRHSKNLRNLAFAEVNTTAGQTEIYVSVSGAGDNTRYLPLFKSSNGMTQVELGSSTYFNVDGIRHPINPAALRLSLEGKLLSIPHLTNDPKSTATLHHATSVDSESKLVDYINQKYPDSKAIRSMTVVTALPPCDSCSIVMKEFGHERGANALNVIWGKRFNPRKRPAAESSSASNSSTDSD